MKKLNYSNIYITAIFSLLASSMGHAQQGDLKKGAELFATHCTECHSTTEGKNKKGPSLFATLGRKAGTNDGFAYSEALRNSKITWDLQNLAGYIENPKKFLPGGKMKYDGLENEVDRTNVLAYLAAQKKN